MKDKRGRINHCMPEERWYEEGEDGSIKLQETTIQQLWSWPKPLPPTVPLALALNELCCEDSHGKVFVAHTEKAPDFDPQRHFPQLFYIPAEWSDDTVTAWQTMKPTERLMRCSANCGWLLDHQPVLSCSLMHVDEDLVVPSLEAHSKAQVAILITPKVYVGPVQEMREVLSDSRRLLKTAHAVHVTPDDVPEDQKWTALDEWRVEGGRGLLKRLDELYHDEKRGFVALYGAVRHAITETLKVN